MGDGGSTGIGQLQDGSVAEDGWNRKDGYKADERPDGGSQQQDDQQRSSAMQDARGSKRKYQVTKYSSSQRHDDEQWTEAADHGKRRNGKFVNDNQRGSNSQRVDNQDSSEQFHQQETKQEELPDGWESYIHEQSG